MIRNALIHLHVTPTEGVKGLQQKVFEIRKTLKVINSSSAYKRRLANQSGQSVEVVIEAQFDDQLDITEIRDKLQSVNAQLLMIEGELRIDPMLPLPHPLLLLDNFVLKMASECAPYWEHRVKQETLQALSYKNSTQDDVEFLTQGTALISL